MPSKVNLHGDTQEVKIRQFEEIAMIDVKYLRDEEKEKILREALKKRGQDESIVDKLKELDLKWRKLTKTIDYFRKERNEKSKLIAELKKKGEDPKELIERMRELGAYIKEKEKEKEKIEKEFDSLFHLIPNIPHPSVPQGKDESENVVLREWGEKREFNFEPRPHWELGEKLGILDFKASSLMSGSRFYTYIGLGAKLERALISFFLDLHTSEHGYKEVFPPFLVKPESMFASGHLPKFEIEMYHIERDNLYLIPTAEVALANLHRGEILNESELPLRYTAYTACFRREAGSYGKDVRGMIRVHQFNKVELFVYSKPEESYAILEEMLSHAEEVLRRLKIPYRIVELCTGDLGFASSKTYDIEAWAPGVGRWLEVSSVSNTESFQARRAQTRLRRKDGKIEYPHTLNGSGLATPRTFIAILENYQEEDGTIVIPEVLRPYMGGLERIEPPQ